jgi:hypothetical protein
MLLQRESLGRVAALYACQVLETRILLWKREEAVREAMGKLGESEHGKREAIREAVTLGHSWGRIASLFGV